MCMKVRVTEGTLQESCHDLQTKAESVDQKEKMDIDPKERKETLPLNPTENLVSQEENPDLLDDEMESVLRQVVQSNRIDVEVLFVFSFDLDANSISTNQTN